MKKILFTVAIVLVFAVGLSVLLYPFVADYMNSRRQSRVVDQYYKDLDKLTEEDFTELFDAARIYNDSLRSRPNRLVLSDAEMEEYLGLMNPFGNGIMGTLIIDLIGVRLPIYHGTSEGVLQIGAGHLEGSSLPVGGSGTHTVITGHRGLPSSILLTKLDKLEKGDTFVIHILNETLTYRVDQILIVKPEDVSALDIIPDMDYCTLVTCTPYGINSHRLLVRGYRVENGAVSNAKPDVILSEAEKIDTAPVVLVVSVPVLIILIAYQLFRFLRKHRRGKS